ncbi:hypothetical protein VIGAN_06155500, partial [Vigna angularis var. angularis]
MIRTWEKNGSVGVHAIGAQARSIRQKTMPPTTRWAWIANLYKPIRSCFLKSFLRFQEDCCCALHLLALIGCRRRTSFKLFRWFAGFNFSSLLVMIFLATDLFFFSLLPRSPPLSITVKYATVFCIKYRFYLMRR